MPGSGVRNLAVTVTTAVAAVALTGLVATSASAATAVPTAKAVGSSNMLPMATASTYPSPFQILDLGTSNLCVGISGGRDDAPAVLWRCEEVANQEWHWGSSWEGTRYRELVNGDNQCLGIAGESSSQGARVVGWNCNGHLDQYWYYNDFLLVDLWSGYNLTVAGLNLTQGAALIQTSDDYSYNNFWTLIPPQW